MVSSPVFIDLPWGLFRTRSEESDDEGQTLLGPDRIWNSQHRWLVILETRDLWKIDNSSCGCRRSLCAWVFVEARCVCKQEGKNLWILNKRSIVRLRSSFENEGDTATCDECLANLTFCWGPRFKSRDMQREAFCFRRLSVAVSAFASTAKRLSKKWF